MQTLPDQPAVAPTPLFPQDSGHMPAAARRAYVHLLRGPSVEQRRNAQLWIELLNHRDLIASRLSEMFLELVVDTEVGVAFTRQIESPEDDFPRLLRRVPLTFMDSVLMLHLRQQLAKAQAAGDRCVVAREDLMEHLELFERTANTDAAGFKKRAGRAVDKMIGHSLLHKIRGAEDRYEVSPTLKLLFAVEQVTALEEQYRKIAAGELQQAVPEEDGESS